MAAKKRTTGARLRRLLLQEDHDEGHFRNVWATILGGTIAVLPLLVGMMELETFLIAATVGALVTLPLWRFVGGPLTRPASIIAMVVLFVVAPALVLRNLPYLAIWTYVGAWVCTLGALRLTTGWKDPA
jgi:hypothetical protein